MTREEALAKGLVLCESLPIQTVARQLHEQYPHHFPTRDLARSALRYRRGSNGETHRRNAGIAEPILCTVAEGIAKLPRAEKVERDPLYFSNCLALLLPDIHFPHHDYEAVSVAIDHGMKLGCNVVGLTGDSLDFHKISKFTKEPDHMSPWEEIEIAKQFFGILNEAFPDAKKFYKEGNHEARLKAFLWSNAKELSDMPCLDLPELLDLDEFGFDFVGTEMVKLGKLAMIHGHELPMGPFSPQNPAATVLRKTKSSTITGHFHRKSEEDKKNIHGEAHAAWTMGCLCNLKPKYSPFAFLDWCHGFAIVEVDSDGQFSVFNHRIINGKVR